jgi:hypothetical protein
MMNGEHALGGVHYQSEFLYGTQIHILYSQLCTIEQRSQSRSDQTNTP